MHQISRTGLKIKIEKRYEWIYERAWDREYIAQQLGKKDIDTLFVGSSYVLFGVNAMFNDSVLALPSQDLYYSVRLVERALEMRLGIPKRVILGVGYYALYHDLSKVKTFDESIRIYDVYYPILHDLHNMKYTDYKIIEMQNGITNQLLNKFANRQLQSVSCDDYFDLKSRKSRARKTWGEVDVEWNQLSIDNKRLAACRREEGHEKLLRFASTKEENKTLIKRLQGICSRYNTMLYTFVAPMTSFYIDNMSAQYRNEAQYLSDYLARLSDGFHDYNYELNEINDNDFVDADHLNECGANKLTALLNRDFKGC